ncbi:hypothetical protein GCM10009808_16260 [Microbacterium sediminicola]|uniref:Uncharacterized protein n=1 Tax=Microbacterium sediminicola TaxID=415210 RepID=A0ABP4U6L6_9MICO
MGDRCRRGVDAVTGAVVSGTDRRPEAGTVGLGAVSSTASVHSREKRVDTVDGRAWNYVDAHAPNRFDTSSLRPLDPTGSLLPASTPPTPKHPISIDVARYAGYLDENGMLRL